MCYMLIWYWVSVSSSVSYTDGMGCMQGNMHCRHLLNIIYIWIKYMWVIQWAVYTLLIFCWKKKKKIMEYLIKKSCIASPKKMCGLNLKSVIIKKPPMLICTCTHMCTPACTVYATTWSHVFLVFVRVCVCMPGKACACACMNVCVKGASFWTKLTLGKGLNLQLYHYQGNYLQAHQGNELHGHQGNYTPS